MKTKFFFNLPLLVLLLLSCQSQQVKQEHIPFSNRIPEPSEMSVNEVVTGRVTTLKGMDILNVGKNIPFTYSLDKVSNTPGYNWYVSKHFAMKTNFTEDKVRLYLELLEMAYPHYVELFGVEPPNIENQRIAAVYSPTRYDASIAMMDDGFKRGPYGGGETMWYNKVGYNFQSSREHHQRYIVIHETCHAFQMAVMDYTGFLPYWFVEGTADAIAHHVYDPKKKRLNVMVFDRGCTMDYIRRGLEEYEADGRPSIKDKTLDASFKRGISFLIIHFMMDHPLYSHQFKIFRDEMAKLRLTREKARVKSVEILQSVFGDWEQVERDFIDYMAKIDKSFNVAGGPWEQEGNAYFVRHNNSDQGCPRIDFLFKPEDKPYYKPFKMDQPMPDPCHLIDPATRGVEEPVVGLHIEYLKDHLHRGKVGLGLGLNMSALSKQNWLHDKKRKKGEEKRYNPDDDILYEIMIEKGNTLVFDGSDFGEERLSYSLPEDFIQTLESQKAPELGLTVTIHQNNLEAKLQTMGAEPVYFIQSVPLTNSVREKLMSRSMAVLAEDAQHHIKPYFDDGRDLNPNPPNYDQEVPNNAFQNPMDKEMTRLVNSVYILREDAPESLTRLTRRLLQVSDKGPDKINEGLILLQKERANVAADLAALLETSPKALQALQAFAGVNVRFEWDKKQDDGRRPVNIVLTNPSDLPLKGTMHLDVFINGETVEKTESQMFSVQSKSRHIMHYIAPPYNDDRVINYTVDADIQWADQSFQLVHEDQDSFPWSSMKIVQQARIENDDIKIAALLRGPFSGESKGTLIIEVMPANLVEQGVIQEDVVINPLEVKKFEHSLKIKEGVQLSDFAVDVRFDMEFEGEPVLLQERCFIHVE